MNWIWEERKNAINRRRHKLSFETASLVFDDSFAASRLDHYPYEERWQTIGAIGKVVILVVHTPLVIDKSTGEETGRIISARKATAHERRIYAEGDF